MFSYFLIYASISIVVLETLKQLLLIMFFKPFRGSDHNENDLPVVSILLAVRNESENIDRCLQSLLIQNYPAQKFEILIGDDNSDDDTWQKVEYYELKNDQVKLYKITVTIGLARGKANVLAQLARKATGEVFVITDADMKASKDWLSSLVAEIPENTGLINGFTGVLNNLLQHYEWIQAQGMMHVLQRWQPVTAIGNNMAVTAEAYFSTGGYEAIPFSVTEDYALTREIVKRGYEIESRLCRETYSETLPVSGLKRLLSQRKRWMHGASRLPLYILLVLGLQAMFYPAIAGLLFLSPQIGLAIFAVKIILQSGFILIINQFTPHHVKWYKFFEYECYSAILLWLEIVVFLLPGKVVWKDRKY